MMMTEGWCDGVPKEKGARDAGGFLLLFPEPYSHLLLFFFAMVQDSGGFLPKLLVWADFSSSTVDFH